MPGLDWIDVDILSIAEDGDKVLTERRGGPISILRLLGLVPDGQGGFDPFELSFPDPFTHPRNEGPPERPTTINASTFPRQIPTRRPCSRTRSAPPNPNPPAPAK